MKRSIIFKKFVLAVAVFSLATVLVHASDKTSPPQQVRDPMKELEAASQWESVCDNKLKDKVKEPNYSELHKTCLDNLEKRISASAGGPGSKSKCPDEIKDQLQPLREKIQKAKESCNNAASSGEDNSEGTANSELGQCAEKIVSCASKKSEVNAIRVEEEDQEKDTLNIANASQALTLLGSNMSLPSSLNLKNNELSETETEYLNQCPQKTLKEYKEAKKDLKTRVDKLEEKKKTLHKDIVENEKKLIDEKKKMDEDGAKTAEKLRDENKKTVEKLSDLNKDKQKAMREIDVQDAEIRGQLRTRNNEMIKKRKMLSEARRKLKSKHHFELICSAQYGESLNKGPKGPKTTVGLKGAMHARNVKLEIISECVRTEWGKVKLDYDLAKDEVTSMETDVKFLRKQTASIMEQKSNNEANFSREEQAIRQGEQNSISASQQHQQQKLQSIQMFLQNQQKEMARLNTEVQKAELDIKKAEKEEKRLGKEPEGESSLADAKTHLSSIKQSLKSVMDAAKTEGGACQKTVEDQFGSVARELDSISLTGDKYQAKSKSSDPERKVAGNNPKTDK